MVGLRIGFRPKEIGRMTLTLFNRYYDSYKQLFDFEMLCYKTGTTYQKAYEKAHESEKWF